MDETAILPDNLFESDLINIILKIPVDTARLDITATVIGEDGAPRAVYATMRPSDIHKARQDFLDNVDLKDDYDACFTLTNKGRELLAKLESEEWATCEEFSVSAEGDDCK